jgi:hypothetical protein
VVDERAGHCSNEGHTVATNFILTQYMYLINVNHTKNLTLHKKLLVPGSNQSWQSLFLKYYVLLTLAVHENSHTNITV